MLGLKVICSVITVFCCVNSTNVYLKVISSQSKGVLFCLGCAKRLYVFCKDAEAFHSTLFEHTVLDYNIYCDESSPLVPL